MQLSDLLPKEAIDQISALIQRGECDASAIKPITQRYAKELLAKGVDADYLAYAIEFTVQRRKSQRGETS